MTDSEIRFMTMNGHFKCIVLTPGKPWRDAMPSEMLHHELCVVGP